MVPEPTSFYTKHEYVQLENAAEYKSEHIDGQIIRRALCSLQHHQMSGGLTGAFSNQLRGKPWEPFGSDLRIEVLETGATLYPDFSIASRELKLSPNDECAYVNPVVLVEIYSPQTEAHDRVSKWSHYQRIASLHDYVLVAQDKIRIEHYSRQNDESWILRIIENADGVIELASVGCRLIFSEVYERVEFPVAEMTWQPQPVSLSGVEGGCVA